MKFFDVTFISQDITMEEFVVALQKGGLEVVEAAPVHPLAKLVVIASRPKEPEPVIGEDGFPDPEKEPLGWAIVNPGEEPRAFDPAKDHQIHKTDQAQVNLDQVGEAIVNTSKK